MQKLHSWRSALSYVTVAALALNILGGVSAFSVAHAADAALTISEINWAGSNVSTNDTWVEIANQGPDYTDSLSLCTDTGTTIFSLPSTKVPAGGYFVVTNALVSATQSTVNRAALSSTVSADLSNLPTTPTNLLLVDGTCAVQIQVLDTIAEQTNAWTKLPGEQNVQGAFSSMERIGTNGDLAANWIDAATTKTVGKNFKAVVSNQFGTPGTANVTLGAPQNVTLTPTGSDGQNTTVTISGTVDPLTYAIEIERVDHAQGLPTLTPPKSIFLSPAIPITVDAQNHFTVTTNEPTAELGVFDFYVRALDGSEADLANRSILVSISSELAGGNTLVITTSEGSLATPVFTTSTPEYIQGMQTTLMGTSSGASSIIILDNGEYAMTVAPDVSGNFSATTGMLALNSQNSFTAIAHQGANNYSSPSTAVIVWQDSIAPSPVNKVDVSTTFTTAGNVATLTGLAGAVTLKANGDPLHVHVYADAAKTTELVNAPTGIAVNADGSFAISTITNSVYPIVYLTVKDQAGNESTEVAITNPSIIQSGSNSGLNPTVISLGSTQATLGWSLVPNANHYLVEYNQVGQPTTAPVAECVGVTTCTPQVTITNLTPGTDYNFQVAAVDAYGNVSAYAPLTFTTTIPAPVITTAVATTPPPVTTAAEVTKRSVDQVTTVTTPSPTPTATPEAGQVKSAATTASARNWTPWIVLLILLAIAVLATIGYFYWFGGDAGESTLAATLAAKQEKDDKKPKDPVNSKSTSSKPDKNKRW